MLFFTALTFVRLALIVLVLLFLMQTPLNVFKYYAITCSWYHVIISIVVKSSKKHHYTFYSTIPQIWLSRGKSTRQDYLPHNALTREQNIWYFLLQRNGFNACKINRILCFFWGNSMCTILQSTGVEKQVTAAWYVLYIHMKLKLLQVLL
jgi:hypothetical protein